MRVATVDIGRLLIISLNSKKSKLLNVPHLAQGYLDNNNRLSYILTQTLDTKYLVQELKEHPAFKEEVRLIINGNIDGEFKEIYNFTGILYDALLIAAKEGEKYDI